MSRLTPPLGARDHLLGRPDAPLTLAEFGDYECPFCGAAQPVVREVLRRFGRHLLFGFRHFPMTQAHPHSLQAAVAAEAAGVQGEFWAMHETLFDNQDALKIDDLVGYAQGLGLDVDRFTEDLGDEELAAKVRRDFTSGVRSGANGTPSFFIDGVRHDGSWALEPLSLAVGQALARKGITTDVTAGLTAPAADPHA